MNPDTASAIHDAATDALCSALVVVEVCSRSLFFYVDNIGNCQIFSILELS